MRRRSNSTSLINSLPQYLHVLTDTTSGLLTSSTSMTKRSKSVEEAQIQSKLASTAVIKPEQIKISARKPLSEHFARIFA